jgi:sugar-specific transcriptional regulator TrmB
MGNDNHVVKEEFLEELRRHFSLNLYEVKIWTALLSRGVSTAGELSDIANVPRSRSYDVLESLEKKGFVVMKVGKPIKYIAVPPDEVVERVKKNVKSDAEERVEQLDSLQDSEVINELNELHNQGIETVDPSEKTGSLKGRHNLYNHIDMALRDATSTVTIMTTSNGFLRKVDGFKPVLEDLSDNGVSIRIAAPMNDDTREVAADLEGIAKVRHADIDARFIVVDGDEVVFMLMDDEDVHPSYDLGVWLNTPFFCQALEELFEVAWTDMESVLE